MDSQVLVHARDMRRNGVAELEVWAVACSESAFASSSERRVRANGLAEGPVRLFRGVPPTIPGSARLNARRLSDALATLPADADLVHARTDYAAAVAAQLGRARPFELVWDCRGDAEAEARQRHRGVWPDRAMLRAIQVHAARRRRRIAAAACDRAIFVTESLRRRVAGGALDDRSEIIPCAADEELFGFDPELRGRTRAALGFGADARVLLYSGGLAPYQCVEDCVELFRVGAQTDLDLRLLIVTHQPERVEPLLAGIAEGRVCVRSARLEQVNAYLNAADAALLLRREDPLNAVAFPTKFAEYGLAGLPVVVSEALPEPHRIAEALGNLCPLEGGRVALPPAPDRPRIAAAYRERLSRGALRERYRRVYAGGVGSERKRR